MNETILLIGGAGRPAGLFKPLPLYACAVGGAYSAGVEGLPCARGKSPQAGATPRWRRGRISHPTTALRGGVGGRKVATLRLEGLLKVFPTFRGA